MVKVEYSARFLYMSFLVVAGRSIEARLAFWRGKRGGGGAKGRTASIHFVDAPLSLSPKRASPTTRAHAQPPSAASTSFSHANNPLARLQQPNRKPTSQAALSPFLFLLRRKRRGPPRSRRTHIMPPKKKDEGPKERPILGRFKNNLKVRESRRPPPPRSSFVDARARPNPAHPAHTRLH